MMELFRTGFDGLLVVQTLPFRDARGGFQKLFNADFFQEHGLSVDFREFYYSVNRKNVIRGMHFQIPPCDHEKLVYVSRGRILDVVVDIRKASSSYGQCFSMEMNDADGRFLYVPRGFAHGFCALEEGTIVNYAQTSGYDRECDQGISCRSIGFSWPTDDPVISERDAAFPDLHEFKSPF